MVACGRGAGFEGFERPALPLPEEPPHTRPGINIVPKTLEQVHLVMGFPGLPHAAPERYALQTLALLLVLKVFVEVVLHVGWNLSDCAMRQPETSDFAFRRQSILHV